MPRSSGDQPKYLTCARALALLTGLAGSVTVCGTPRRRALMTAGRTLPTRAPRWAAMTAAPSGKGSCLRVETDATWPERRCRRAFRSWPGSWARG